MAPIWGAMVTGDYTRAGVPDEIWITWDQSTRDKYLEDYFRTDAQRDYVDNLDWQTKTAYAYTGIVDAVTGLESVEIGETTNETIETVQTYVQEDLPRHLNLAGEGALLLGIGALALLLRK